MRPASMWARGSITWPSPKSGRSPRSAALAPTRPNWRSWCSGSKPAALKPWRWNRPASTEIALYQKLEAAGFEVRLVDARRAKHVPGRKSDVQDCRWLQQLHSYGLLAAAFRPEDAICRLRTLQRHRKSLVECAAMWLQHLQKALTEMNLHLHHVLADITGQSGLAILEAILAGERNPRTLAGLVDRRVKQGQDQIEAALTGDYRAEALFVVGQALQTYRQLQQQIAQCDLAIEKHLATMGEAPTPQPSCEPL